MMRETLKNINRNEKLQEFTKKYKIPIEYLLINRKMISKGVFIGLFIAFIPMPMQMLAVVSMMPFAKFNVPIAISMCWLSNPFTMPAMYYMEYLTGTFLLQIEVIQVEMTLEWFSQNIGNIFIPLYAGTLFYSIAGSTIAYYLINHFWRRSIRKTKFLRKNGNSKKTTKNIY